MIGEIAAITVSLFWSFGSIFFTYAGRRAGVLNLNALRIVIAVALLGLAHLVVFGTMAPRANDAQWLYMGLSGVVGLALGDLAYFGCLVILGPRKGVLLLSASPIFSSIAGFIVLGEVLGAWAILGVAVTISGVAWVVFESEERSDERVLEKRKRDIGIMLGIGGSVCQGVGLVISKYGMLDAAGDPSLDLNPLSAAMMRMAIAAVAMWVGIAFMRRHSGIIRTLKDRKTMGATFGGAFFGPFLGVWLSMVAVTYTLAGVASTLMSLMPVMVIPIVWIIHKQRTSWRGFVGAAVAIVGIAILFLT